MDFYQFWINTPDDVVEEYLKIFTQLDEAEVLEIMHLHKEDPTKRRAQRRLADAVTVIVHGEQGIEKARSHADSLSAGSTNLAPVMFKSPAKVESILVETGLAESNSDARRVIEDGGVYLNSKKFDKLVVDTSDLTQNPAVIRRGKKLQRSALIELE